MQFDVPVLLSKKVEQQFHFSTTCTGHWWARVCVCDGRNTRKTGNFAATCLGKAAILCQKWQILLISLEWFAPCDLSVLMRCSYVCIPCGQGVETFKVLLKCSCGSSTFPAGNRTATVPNIDVRSFILSLSLSFSPGSGRIQNEMCMCHPHY